MTEIFKKYCILDPEFQFDRRDEAFDVLKSEYDQSYGTIREEGNLISIHTGGWSENEMLIESFRDTLWYKMKLVCKFEGGHYYFDTDKMNRNKKHWEIIKK